MLLSAAVDSTTIEAQHVTQSRLYNGSSSPARGRLASSSVVFNAQLPAAAHERSMSLRFTAASYLATVCHRGVLHCALLLTLMDCVVV